MADTEASPAPPSATVPFFKKKTKTSGNTATKKRAASPSLSSSAAQVTDNVQSTHERDDDRGEGPSVVRLAKKEMYNPLKQASSNKRRKQNNGRDDGNDSDDDFDLQEAAKPFVKYSDRNVAASIKQKDEEDRILAGEAALVESGEAADTTPDGMYKGKAAYASQLPTGSQKYAPIKGPSSDIRTITLMDYQPDRCKDYAE
jgi:RING finger protein 113A